MMKMGLTGLAAGAGFALLSALPANAADLGGDCCADLEERVAELEATTVRKGNRKVSLTISGHVNSAVLYWDDNHESNAYVVGNANDDLSIFRFEGDAKIGHGWSAGYLIELEIANAASNSVNQDDDNGNAGVEVADSSMWIESETYGKVTWGFAAQPSDDYASEIDLSGTVFAGYAAVDAVAGGFFIRSANGALLTDITVENFIGDLNGGTINLVRYDTPEIAGFGVSASWGEDDIWDVALHYAGEFGGLEVEAGISYIDDSDTTNAAEDTETVVGSVSVLHTHSGLNLTFAAGEQQTQDPATPDKTFYYVKGGWKKDVSGMGDTALYGEYGQYDDFAVGENAGMAVGDITGSEAEIWGLGVVQYFDAAAMQLYLGYRHYDFEADGTVAKANFEEFDTVIAGGRIEF